MMADAFNTYEPICIELLHTENFNKRLPEIMNDLIECTAFVNERFIQDKMFPDNGKYIVLKFL